MLDGSFRRMLPLSMGMLLFGKGTTINNGVFYKLVNYILFKGCLLGRFSTSRTASFWFSGTYIARYVHT